MVTLPIPLPLLYIAEICDDVKTFVHTATSSIRPVNGADIWSVSPIVTGEPVDLSRIPLASFQLSTSEPSIYSVVSSD